MGDFVLRRIFLSPKEQSVRMLNPNREGPHHISEELGLAPIG